jgi:hypothetical protein
METFHKTLSVVECCLATTDCWFGLFFIAWLAAFFWVVTRPCTEDWL